MPNQPHQKAIMCPQCNAPLKVHRFGLSVVCQYCGATVRLDDAAISAERFRKAYRAWNKPENYGIAAYLSIGGSHWVTNKQIAEGESSRIYTGMRARFPTELAILKILYSNEKRALFDNEWKALQTLQRSNAPGAEVFTRLIPQPIVQGEITGGAFKGQRASIFRWKSGFHHNFESVRQRYPHGIEPRASIWIWRRILETLSFIHGSGMVHGAVLPPHLFPQENDHGILLVGYSRSGRFGEALRGIPPGFEAFYPTEKLMPQLDIIMSARSVVYALGGDPATAELPGAVPASLAQVIRRVALGRNPNENAWDIRNEIGRLADIIYAAPKFCPIVMD